MARWGRVRTAAAGAGAVVASGGVVVGAIEASNPNTEVPMELQYQLRGPAPGELDRSACADLPLTWACHCPVPPPFDAEGNANYDPSGALLVPYTCVALRPPLPKGVQSVGQMMFDVPE
jgi:hypothetical protein